MTRNNSKILNNESVIEKVEKSSNIDEEVYINNSTDTAEWMIPCNIAYYDVIGAFNELKNIEWKQSVNIKVNDIVYIYVGNPYKEIKYKCIARKVDLPLAGRIDDSKFIIDNSNYKNTGRYMELELLEKRMVL
jgi:5-methylcytosine-specific restriction protein A